MTSPRATPLPTIGTLQAGVPLSNDEPVIGWLPFPGAVQYQMTGEVRAVRINAEDAFCTPPLQTQQSVLALDQNFDSLTTEYRIPFPVVPLPDRWFIYGINVTLEAFDAQGNKIAAFAAAGIGETNAMCPTQTPLPVLPDSGSGQGNHAAVPPWSIALLALAGLSLVVLAAATRRRA